MELLDHIEVVPDFPKPGINFYDIQSVLKKPDIWDVISSKLAEISREQNPDIILGIESRGFLTGLSVAEKLNLPFSMIRKRGKLPGTVITQEYELEYGTDAIEIQDGLVEPDMRVVIVDDLLATGGTMRATADLVRKIGGNVLMGACIIELHELNGREKLDFPFKAPLDPFSTKKSAKKSAAKC